MEGETPKKPSVFILCIGEELVEGKVGDTNGKFLSNLFSQSGIHVGALICCGDNLKEIVTLLKFGLTRWDGVVTTGGLGSTFDDLTREAISELTGKPLIFFPEIFEKIEEYLKKRFLIQGFEYQETRKQATAPEGVHWLRNPVGSAPPFLTECFPGKWALSLPGVPAEIEGIHLLQPIPQTLFPSFDFSNQKTEVKEFKYFGVRELQVEEKIRPLIEKYVEKFRENDPGFKAGILASMGEVSVRFHRPLPISPVIETQWNQLLREMESVFPDHLISKNGGDLFQSVATELKNLGRTIGVIESITGGMVGGTFSKYSGSSSYFKGGILTYCNELKSRLGGVDPTLLEKFGPVSEWCSREMALEGKKRLLVDFCLSLTGFAEKTPGEQAFGQITEPVDENKKKSSQIENSGEVFISIAYGEGEVKTFHHFLHGSRENNRQRSTLWAFYYLLKLIRGELV